MIAQRDECEPVDDTRQRHRLRVTVVGLRGIPDVEGGIERHAEHLYPLLVAHGCDVELIARRPYHPPEKPIDYRGVRIRPLWSPRSRSLETLVHTFLAVLYAGIRRPDVLHIHAIGPALFAPMARLLGLRVVVTHHGADYEREKWGRFGKATLRIGEWVGMRCANARIAISQTIRDGIADRHSRDSVVIPNGVDQPEVPTTINALQQFGLQRRRYVLQVSRFVPEKRQVDLIRAFRSAALHGWKLALVGRADPEDAYVREVIREVGEGDDVVLTGFQHGLALHELFAHAGAFVLPSSHEGLPIALLEALSFALPVVASDIPANREIALPDENYFATTDAAHLARRLKALLVETAEHTRLEGARCLASRTLPRYEWQTIAQQTLAVFERVASL